MTAPVERHRLSSAQLTEIAWGRPEPDVVKLLYAADDSRQRLLTAHALRQNGAGTGAVTDALAVLADSQRRDPGTTAEVLRAGWLGAWAAAMLDGPADLPGIGNRLGALAAAAAFRTGLHAELNVPVVDDCLHFPTLGTLALPAAGRGSTAVVRVGEGLAVELAGQAINVTEPYADGPWKPVRELTDGIHLWVDDRDPYRDCFGVRPRGPLSDAEFHRWREGLRQAWHLLNQFVPAMAEQVSLGLRVLVPLAPTPDGEEVSVSCGDALGALASTLPLDGVMFAMTLVHEWSHSLLNGLLGFDSLHDTRSAATYFAPWRHDPRPLSGLLHGVFAFMAVAETWRSLLVANAGGERAETEFAVRRAQLAEVLTHLPGDPGLSQQGHRFVAVMERRCAALFETTVRREVASVADAGVAARKVAWARRHRDKPA
jgi:HEXXH motif-containing protein